MAGSPRVLVLVYSHLERDARVLRQVSWLSRHFDVTSAAFGLSPISDVEHIELEDLPPYRGRLMGRIVYAGLFVLGLFGVLVAMNPRDRAAAKRLADHDWDVIIANDASAIPLAVRLAPGSSIIVDLHEYSTRQGEESIEFRLTTARYFRWLFKQYLPKVAAVTTVSQGIADEYRREFKVRPVVVANAAAFEDRKPSTVGSTIRVVHSAAPSPTRRVEVMIEAVRDTVANVSLDLFLVDDGSGYLQRLRHLAADVERVRIHDAVPSSDLIRTLADYDVGVHLLPPINFNHLWALPNKLFDFVQARLGIIVGPSPEMARIVRDHGLGAVTDDFTSVALTRLLDQLDPSTVARWKESTHEAARHLSGESQMETFERMVRDVLVNLGRGAD